ncbi:MAG: right-handed parallel beta-helix repeat-containing protein [Phycisphaerae bacterium]
MPHRKLMTLAGLASTIGFGEFVVADTINVPGDVATIQAAIDAAVSGVDEVVVAPGTYNEVINFLGKAITLRSSGGAAVTIIDGTGLNDSVVKCISGEGSDTVLDGFTITNGTGGVDSFCTGVGNFSGGGMLNDASSPTVTNCTFTANMAVGGGMANCDGSNPTVTNCAFIGNSDFFFGGGGMLNSASSPIVTNCRFSENATCNGGGMFNWNNSSPTVTNCAFIGNTTFCIGGGGIWDNDGGSAITNCTFSGNVGEARGGGLYVQNASTTVTNCTFSGNNTLAGGGKGGGIFVTFAATNLMATNCIFWNNSDDGGTDESAQIHIDAGTAIVTYSDIHGLVPGGAFDSGANTNNINADPLFVDADGQDDAPGTEDDNLRLSPDSPCIDAGDNTAVPPDTADLDDDNDTTEPTPLDLDGNPRFVDDPDTPNTGNGTPPIVDIGAYEFQGPPPIPTVSQWGMVAMALLILTAGTVVLMRRRGAGRRLGRMGLGRLC